jgi:hypothetical protein
VADEGTPDLDLQPTPAPATAATALQVPPPVPTVRGRGRAHPVLPFKQATPWQTTSVPLQDP